jgi:hypothetical protein
VRLFLDIEIKERRLSDVGARNDGRITDVTEMRKTSGIKVRQYFQRDFRRLLHLSMESMQVLPTTKSPKI